jgi:hypothetical protein
MQARRLIGWSRSARRVLLGIVFSVLMIVIVAAVVPVSLAFAAATSPLTAQAQGSPWSDLPDGLLDSYGITQSQVMGISSGYSDGTFQPYQNISRAQFVKMADAAFSISPADPSTATFLDVPVDHYYYAYIEGAFARGLVNGIGGGLFGPDSGITREQAIAIIVREVAAEQNFDLATLTEGQISTALAGFADGPSVSTSLRAEMAYAVINGITKGDSSANLAPQMPLERLAAVALLVRAHQGAVVLTVKYEGTVVKTYSLSQLEALPAFSGYAGFRTSGGTNTGPEAVTGVKITDIVADARGMALSSSQVVLVASGSFSKTFTYDRLINFTGFAIYKDDNPVAVTSLNGPLASVLVYSNPTGNVMPAGKGPLRFMVADGSAGDSMVMYPGSDSVSSVDTLNVGDVTMSLIEGDGQTAKLGTSVATPPSVKVTCTCGYPVPGVNVTFAVASGGGSVTGGSTFTDASGIATVGSWILGSSEGTNTLIATSAGLSGSPVTFTAQATTKAIPTVSSWPTATAITLGQALSASTLVGGAASVPGIFVFTDPATVPGSIGSYSASVTFIPTNMASYDLVTGNVNVTTDPPGTVLTVKYQGATIKTYTMAQLRGLAALTGFAGLRCNCGYIAPVDAVTGVKIIDIVADARGTVLTNGQAVMVSSGGYGYAFSYDRLISFTGFTMYDAATDTPVLTSSLTGPLASMLVYSDPAGKFVDPGTLRFFVADMIDEHAVMTPGYESVSDVDTLEVIEPTLTINDGNDQFATVGTTVDTAPSAKVTDAVGDPVAGVAVTFAVASGGGSVSPAGGSVTTNASGIASLSSWTLGSSPGANTLTATSAGLNGSPVTFAATGTTKGTPTISIWPTASTITLGQALSTSTLSGGSALVAGSFAFTNPDTVPGSSGTYNASVTFTPGDTAAYNTVLGSVPVTVDQGAVVLTVKYQGAVVKTYSMAQLQALTPFEGFAGTKSSGDTVRGPDAVIGVKITDIVADARGAAHPLNPNQSVTIAQTAGGSYSKTFSYEQLTSFTGFTLYDATSKNEVPISSLTGPLGSILVYSDPAGQVLTGQLRFFVADHSSENMVMTGSDSVSSVDTLDVTEPSTP